MSETVGMARAVALGTLTVGALALSSGATPVARAAGAPGHDPGAAIGRDGGSAEARRWLASLDAIAGRHVVLLVPPGGATEDRFTRLAADLDAAAAAMAPRVPVTLDGPLTIVVEPDFPAQARHAGRIGEAVVGGPAEVHLVVDARDDDAYHAAVGEALLRREPRLSALPPWIRRGAALWLAGGWYGRDWRGLLPALAAAGAAPGAGELLAAEEQADASAPLWVPFAAGVVERLPGNTVVEKLAVAPDPASVAAALAAVESEALAAAPAASADPRTGAGGPSGAIHDDAAPAASAGRRSTTAETGPGLPADARDVAGASRPPPPPASLRGVSLAMSNSLDGGYHAPAVVAALDRLAALGADAVSLMPFAYQEDPRRPGLAFLNRHPQSETDAGVIHAARRAHERGFAVLWKPQLWISHESWPGEVEMASEADWAAWWAGYRRYILHHAFLAAWADADMFCIGVELDRTAGREREWRELIAAVRRLYGGPLTYASNWHGGLAIVPFWDALDVVGVDAYWPLAEARAAPEEVAAGGRRVAAVLAAFATRTGKPLVLTEVGFAARRAAWSEPHAEGGELSEADQAIAYRALFDALGRPSWLAGAFVWKAFSGGAERRDRPDFRFVGRPAEEEVRRWFAQ